jgi:hypothetical protein
MIRVLTENILEKKKRSKKKWKREGTNFENNLVRL